MDLSEYNRRRRILVNRLQSVGVPPYLPQATWASLVAGKSIHIAVANGTWFYVTVVPAPQKPIETIFGINAE